MNQLAKFLGLKALGTESGFCTLYLQNLVFLTDFFKLQGRQSRRRERKGSKKDEIKRLVKNL